jgi:hypothetical protein
VVTQKVLIAKVEIPELEAEKAHRDMVLLVRRGNPLGITLKVKLQFL